MQRERVKVTEKIKENCVHLVTAVVVAKYWCRCPRRKPNTTEEGMKPHTFM